MVIYFAYDSLGSLMGIIGAGAGFFLIYLSPLIINIIYFMVKHPETLDSDVVSANEVRLDSLDISKASNGQIQNTVMLLPLREKIGVSEKPYSYSRNVAFVIMNILLMVFGMFTLVIQFVNINYFGVHVRDSQL
jgi:hypothetical protein